MLDVIDKITLEFKVRGIKGIDNPANWADELDTGHEAAVAITFVEYCFAAATIEFLE